MFLQFESVYGLISRVVLVERDRICESWVQQGHLVKTFQPAVEMSGETLALTTSLYVFLPIR